MKSFKLIFTVGMAVFMQFAYTTAGAENLIKNGSFEEGSLCWKEVEYEGKKFPPETENEIVDWKVDDKEFYKGGKSLKISVKKEIDPRGKLVALAADAGIPLQGETSYYFRIAYKTRGFSSDRAIWVRMSVHDKEGKPLTKNYFGVTLPSSEEWTVKEVKAREYITPKEAEKGYLTVFFMSKGEFWLDDLCLEPEKPFSEEEKITFGEKTFFYKPRDKGEKDPPLAKASFWDNFWDKRKGYILYQRSPRMLYPDSIPQPEERRKELKNFATPGEYSAIYFSLYGLRGLKMTGFTVNNLHNEKGKEISGKTFQRKTIKFWPQRDSLNGNTYYIIPELLEDFERQDIPEGKSQGFWLQVKVSRDAEPGDYEGKVSLEFENAKKAEIPILLKVLPFTLKEPPVDWMVFSCLGLIKKYSEQEKLRYLMDMKEYGITALGERIFWDFDIVDGQATNVKSAAFNEFQELRRKVGLKGPWLENIHCLEEQVITKITKKKCDTSTFPYPGIEKPEVRRAFISLLKEMDKQIKETGKGGYDDWYYFGVDEPHNEGRMPQAIWECSAAKEAGVKTLSCVYPYDSVCELAPYLDISLNSFLTKSKKDYIRYSDLAMEKRFKYWYLGGGAYGGQEGGLMPDRRHAGFLFYKTGASCHTSWPYQLVREDPYNDFDGGGAEPKDTTITYPARKISADRVSLSTLQWEGIREGITDYKYAYTLKEYIKAAREKGFTGEAAKGDQILNEVFELVPWGDELKGGNCYASSGNFTSEKADKLRWMLASEIIRLKEMLNETR